MTKKRKPQQRERLMYFYIVLFFLATVYVGKLFYNSLAYEKKIYPGIKIAGIDVGGKTKEQAKALVSKRVAEAGTPDLVLVGKEEYRYSQKELGISYNVEKTLDEAFNVGRDDNLEINKCYNEDIPVVIEFDHDTLSKKFFALTRAENEKVENAAMSLNNGKIIIQKESLGKRLLFGENLEMIGKGLGNFENKFSLKIKTLEPTAKESDIKSAEKEIEKLSSTEFVLTGGNIDYKLTSKDLTSFLSFEKNQGGPTAAFASALTGFFPKLPFATIIAFDRENIRNWVPGFSQNIDTEPMNAKLSGGTAGVTVVASSRDGRKVQRDELTDKIKTALDEGKSSVEVPINVTKPEVRDDNLTELGLKGLVSTGWTDFSGSPVNRRHNVGTGAAKFNGTLIKPGENFSFNDTLGPVDASTGYLPELVIKENKTIPEYGGGLCQVSSTAFRAALNAGLPITSRSAHAYPVGYYKPYGVDATIYLPSPDLMFKNDTPGYILVQTHINGNKLYFDFYGTKKDVKIKFAGDAAGTQGVSDLVEGITPTITDKEARGEGSFTAEFYRFLYDSSGKLIKKNNWISRYDSPKKYPH